jgi:hypothetical protein
MLGLCIILGLCLILRAVKYLCLVLAIEIHVYNFGDCGTVSNIFLGALPFLGNNVSLSISGTFANIWNYVLSLKLCLILETVAPNVPNSRS